MKGDWALWVKLFNSQRALLLSYKCGRSSHVTLTIILNLKMPFYYETVIWITYSQLSTLHENDAINSNMRGICTHIIKQLHSHNEDIKLLWYIPICNKYMPLEVGTMKTCMPEKVEHYELTWHNKIIVLHFVQCFL